MRPKVSITMPVLNGDRYIGEAIQSIVDQTYRNCELIVIDDGSTDRTADCVRSFAGKLDLTYVRHESSQGIAKSMNDGVRHSDGELIAFLDHDDGWFSDFLETEVSYLEEHPDVAMVHSDFQTTDVDGNVIEPSVAVCRKRIRPSGRVFRQLFMDSFIVGNSVLIRAECFRRLGLFDESLRWGDYHMWMRIARHYRVDYIGRVLTKYRQHPTQSTRSSISGSVYEDPVGLIAIQKILELHPEVREEIGERMIRRRMASFHFDLAWTLWESGSFPAARTGLSKAIRLWRTNVRYYMLYIVSLLSPSQAFALRRGWRSARRFLNLNRWSGIQAADSQY